MSKISNNATVCRMGGILSTVILLIGMIVIGSIVADMYGISLRNEKRSILTQEYVNSTSSQVNKTVAQILLTQQNNNERGNLTIDYFTKVFQVLFDADKNQQGNLTDHRIVANFTRDAVLKLINTTESETNQALTNQEQYFKPYLNESFGKIFKALNITESLEK